MCVCVCDEYGVRGIYITMLVCSWTCTRCPMVKASDFESEDWGFKFRRGRAQWLRLLTSNQKIGGSNSVVVEFLF